MDLFAAALALGMASLEHDHPYRPSLSWPLLPDQMGLSVRGFMLS